MECRICKRKDTKYQCTVCGTSICNVCAVTVDENDLCYDEANYRVGKCTDICVNKKPEVETDGEEMGGSGRQEVMKNIVRRKITGNFSEKTKETGKQTNICNFVTTNNTSHGDFGFKRKLNGGVAVQSEIPSKRNVITKKLRKMRKVLRQKGAIKDGQ